MNFQISRRRALVVFASVEIGKGGVTGEIRRLNLVGFDPTSAVSI
jgi:hypothetical protein